MYRIVCHRKLAKQNRIDILNFERRWFNGTGSYCGETVWWVGTSFEATTLNTFLDMNSRHKDSAAYEFSWILAEFVLGSISS